MTAPVPDDCELVLTPVDTSTPPAATTPAAVTLLATHTEAALSSGSNTFNITLDAPVPGDGIINIVSGSLSINGNGASSSVLSAASDSSGTPWSIATLFGGGTKAFIGYAATDDSFTVNPSHPPLNRIMVGSVFRECTTHDLVAGDSISVQWLSHDTFDPGGDLGDCSLDCLVIYTPTLTTAERWDGHIEYGWGAGHPDDTPDVAPYTSNEWRDIIVVDLGLPEVSSIPFPDADAHMLTAIAAQGATSYTPLHAGTTFTYSGSLFLASTFSDVAATVPVDPGGSFGGDAILLTAGNYQFLKPIPADTGGGDTTGCELDLVPEEEDCDLVLIPAPDRAVGTSAPARSLIEGSAGISAGAFGSGGSVQQVLGGAGVSGPSGIVSGEAFGAGGFATSGAIRIGTIPGAGIRTATTFGVGGIASLGSGLLHLIGNAGIPAGSFGTGGTLKVTVKGSAGIPTGQVFGTTGIVQRTVGIRGSTGIVSAGAFGSGGKVVQIVVGSAGITAGAFGSGGVVFRPGAALVDNHLLLSLSWQA